MGMEEAERFEKIREEVPGNVDILVATKGRDAEKINKIAGKADFLGENYVGEAESKKPEITFGDTGFRMIGHLQKNKINKAIRVFDTIDTVESVYRAKHINKRVLRDRNKPEVVCPMPVLMQVNIGREDSKYGAEPEEEVLENLASEIMIMEGLKLEGMMTLAPRKGRAEKYFGRMKDLFKHVNRNVCDLRTLSIGSSKYYQEAVGKGANMVRLGTIIFGLRG